jgi:hypothetical protein
MAGLPRPNIRRRVSTAISLGLVLIGIVVLLLAFVDSYSINEVFGHCSPSLSKSKWPLYLGCVMAAHEGLAGGLIGAAGALFAAWLAYEAIQEQLSIEDTRRLQRQDDAKAVATMSIAPPIQAAAAALAEIEAARKVEGEATIAADKRVETATGYLATALIDGAPEIQQIAGDLSLDDRLIFQSIIGTLKTFVSISNRPSPALNRTQRLQNQRRALMNIHTYLMAFGDPDLAAVYERDSGTTPPKTS